MSAIFIVIYEQSLLPPRDSRGKRTSERARNRLPRWNVTRVSSRWCSDTRVTIQRRGQFSHPLACSFPSTIPGRKERLLGARRLNSHFPRVSVLSLDCNTIFLVVRDLAYEPRGLRRKVPEANVNTETKKGVRMANNLRFWRIVPCPSQISTFGAIRVLKENWLFFSHVNLSVLKSNTSLEVFLAS